MPPQRDDVGPGGHRLESVNVSYNGKSSTQLEVGTVAAPIPLEGAIAQLPTDGLQVEQTTRLAKISIVDID
jgi:hypothetical protein